MAYLNVSASYPDDTNTWVATGVEVTDFPVGNWSIQAFAICMTAA